VAGDLLALPIRLGLRAASFAVRTGLQASERAFGLASGLAKVVIPTDGQQPESATSRAHEPSPGDGGPAGSDTSAASTPADPVRSDTAPADTEATGTPPAAAAPSTEQTVPEPPPASMATPPTPTPLSEEPTSLPDEPAHVSEEPTFVEAFAEPGAQDCAGAQVTVDEPWEGYDQMNAPDLIERLTGATPEELAAVALYEAVNRNRQMVISAVERQLQTLTAGGAATADPTRKEPTDGA
jgi:hypothetical protein